MKSEKNIIAAVEIPAADIKKYRQDIINSISELVKIPTVYHKDSIREGMPYGEKVYQGYAWLKEKALADGFEVLEYDGHALAIRMKESSGRIDVVSHVDVVEPGNGWKEDPFSGKITRRYIHGRGTQDMKGALILTYYALKYIKDYGIPCRKELRLVIGCDEERTMEDMRYYISRAGEPDFAFTPDGRFPFSLGEKGALMWHIEGSLDTCIAELEGGVQCNVVSPKATALVKDINNLETYEKVWKASKYKGEIRKEERGIRITVLGKAAHASRPELGVNAAVKLLELIKTVNEDPLASHLYQCFSDYNGKGGNIPYDIEPMGKLTLNLGILNIKENRVRADIDCRYPYGVTSAELTRHLGEVLEPLKVELKYDDKPTLADAKSPYINTLLSSYRKVSRDEVSQPDISGGVTYSKAIGNCVAFGPGRDGMKSLAHQANEKIETGSLELLFNIYLETMIRLANL